MADPLLSAGSLENDISAQLLTRIFGTGWDSLASLASGAPADGVMGTLIFDLMYVLNSCCAVAVAWLFILTVLSAALGSAQDGTGIGGRRYSSAWLPLRYSFAMGAITPVFHGLSAMQVMVLSAIGLSIQFADGMWEQGLAYISRTGAVTAVGGPGLADNAARVLPVIAEHAYVRRYLETAEGCVFASSSRILEEDSAGTRVRFELPRPLTCTNPFDGQTAEAVTENGDMGSVTVSTPVPEATLALRNALAGPLYTQVYNAVKNATGGDDFRLIAPDTGPAASLGLHSLLTAYEAAVSVPLSRAAVSGDEAAQKALASFRDYAGRQGWFMAGSYYWTLARTAADAVKMQRDETTASGVSGQALTGFVNGDLRKVLTGAAEMRDRLTLSLKADPEKITNPLTATGQAAEKASRDAAGVHDTGSVIARFFGSGPMQWLSELRVPDAGALALGRIIDGGDIIFSTVRLSRRVMNACENAFVTYLAIREGVSRIPFAGNFLTSKALPSFVESAGKIAVCIAAPIWAVCWFYAYMVPMLPFVAWFTAVIGWVVLTLEAVAACPVWLVGHCMPEGDGFAGASARSGYALMLSVLLRPMLLVLAFFLCMIILSVSGYLVSSLLMPFFDAQDEAFRDNAFGLSGWGVTAAVSTLVLLGSVVGIGTWKLFTLVTVMPDRIIRWAGQLIAPLGDSGAGETVRLAAGSMQRGAAVLAPGAAAAGALGAILPDAAPGRSSGILPSPKRRWIRAGARPPGTGTRRRIPLPGRNIRRPRLPRNMPAPEPGRKPGRRKKKTASCRERSRRGADRQPDCLPSRGARMPFFRDAAWSVSAAEVSIEEASELPEMVRCFRGVGEHGVLHVRRALDDHEVRGNAGLPELPVHAHRAAEEKIPRAAGKHDRRETGDVGADGRDQGIRQIVTRREHPHSVSEPPRVTHENIVHALVGRERVPCGREIRAGRAGSQGARLGKSGQTRVQNKLQRKGTAARTPENADTSGNKALQKLPVDAHGIFHRRGIGVTGQASVIHRDRPHARDAAHHDSLERRRVSRVDEKAA